MNSLRWAAWSGCACLLACAGPDEIDVDEAASEHVVSVEAHDQALSALSETLRLPTGLTPFTDFPICFTGDAATADKYAPMRYAMLLAAGSWSDATNGRLRFSGFGTCGAGLQVEVRDIATGGETNWYGRAANRITIDTDEARKGDVAYGVALHELGHALGLTHEAFHPDSTCSDVQSIAGNIYWQYDPDSIMNYCRPVDALSAGDIAGIRRLYGGDDEYMRGESSYWITSNKKLFLHVERYARTGADTPRMLSSVSATSPIGRYALWAPHRMSFPLRYGGSVSMKGPNGFLGIKVFPPNHPDVPWRAELINSPSAMQWTMVGFDGATGGDVMVNEAVGLAMVANGKRWWIVNETVVARNGTTVTLKVVENAATTPPNANYAWRFIGPTP